MDMETRMPEVYDECVVNRNEAINILNINILLCKKTPYIVCYVLSTYNIGYRLVLLK